MQVGFDFISRKSLSSILILFLKYFKCGTDTSFALFVFLQTFLNRKKIKYLKSTASSSNLSPNYSFCSATAAVVVEFC